MIALNTLLSKYRLMESSLQSKFSRNKVLLEELESSLAAVKVLVANNQQDYQYTFELGDTLFAEATIAQDTHKVGLWLGAGLMLEYDLPEAIGFLEEKAEERRAELTKNEHDMDFVRRQITTTEVTVARIYNLIVRQNQRAAV